MDLWTMIQYVQYRESHLVVDLSWVDFDLGILQQPLLPNFKLNWALSRPWNTPNSSHTNLMTRSVFVVQCTGLFPRFCEFCCTTNNATFALISTKPGQQPDASPCSLYMSMCALCSLLLEARGTEATAINYFLHSWIIKCHLSGSKVVLFYLSRMQQSWIVVTVKVNAG